MLIFPIFKAKVIRTRIFAKDYYYSTLIKRISIPVLCIKILLYDKTLIILFKAIVAFIYNY